MKYFVLNPMKRNPYGAASRKGIRAYAEAIKKENPELHGDLISWLRRIEIENSITPPEDRIKR